MGDLSKELAKMWKEVPTDEKAPFEVCACACVALSQPHNTLLLSFWLYAGNVAAPSISIICPGCCKPLYGSLHAAPSRLTSASLQGKYQ